MFERLMFRKVELWVVGLICVAAFVGVILVSAIARKTAEGNKRFGLVGEAALALSMAPENLMRPARLLINGASIPDVIRRLRNEDYLIVDETRLPELLERRGSPSPTRRGRAPMPAICCSAAMTVMTSAPMSNSSI